MRITTYNSALLLAATVMTGCLRAIHYTSAPGASGRVVDSVNQRPVPDAIITLVPDEIGPYSNKNVPVRTRTSPRGVFKIPQQTDWILYDVRSPAAHFGFCAPARLQVQHPGFELFKTNIPVNQFQANAVIQDFNLGDIRLKRVQK